MNKYNSEFNSRQGRPLNDFNKKKFQYFLKV